MAIKNYKKGTSTQLSTNFNSKEFDCHGSGCCTSTSIDSQLVEYLQKIRDHFGKPITISSAYRCPTHNKNIGGATGSRHSTGQAADIYINGVTPADIAEYAEELGILGIGLYETNADGHFVHIDTRPNKFYWYGQAQVQKTTFKQNKKIEGGNTGMKYSTSKKPLVCMQSQSTCYKGTSKMTVKGVLWHSTAANNTSLKRYIQPSDKKPSADTYSKTKWLEVLGKNQYNNDMNHIDRKMGMNAWIGKLADGTVAAVQSMPWDYRPWGCASGSKGSCNDGWIQFEICEDDLKNKDYFETVYKEACELTAYLCKTYNLDPKGTVTHNGVKVPVILCHQDSYQLKLGGNHGDVYHWFKKYGKDMNDVRNDVAKLLADEKKPAKVEKPAASTNSETNAKPKYVIRKTWIDTKSQIGAYANLDNAKAARDKAGFEYEVYDINTGALIYPVAPGGEDFKKGDTVTLLPNSKWSTGAQIPAWAYKKVFYVREIYQNGLIAISTLKEGAITGTIKSQYLNLKKASTVAPAQPVKDFKPYLVIINTNALNVRGGAGTQYGVNTTVQKGQVFTIVNENNGWGKLKSGAGWIDLKYTKKL